tara:strand:- start:4623 stop:4886 length:264 start_codon:yes stop_codon:yes gene_type:complete
MIKEIRYLIFLIVIFLFLFFTLKYYFSDSYKKKSYRSLANIGNKIETYSKKIPVLDDDTQNSIEYVKNTQTKKKKKYHFWKLLDKNE